MNLDNNQAFTLIELLVVIAILSVLAVAVTLILNPAELMRQARDSTRLSDLATINKPTRLTAVWVTPRLCISPYQTQILPVLRMISHLCHQAGVITAYSRLL